MSDAEVHGAPPGPDPAQGIVPQLEVEQSGPGKAEGERPSFPASGVAAPKGPLARHWIALGIPPTDDVQRLDASYYVVVEKFSENPTEEEEVRRQEMQRAYAVLRRSLVAHGRSRPRPKVEFDLSKKKKIAVCVAAAIGLFGVLYFNLGALRLQWVSYEPGTVIRLANVREPYGTVMNFDSLHKFPIGEPSRAYQVRLAENGRDVWLSERIVEKGMVRVK